MRLSLMVNQAGDTIVEVLITIMVISTVLVGAYITTNKNIASTQDAQERTQALKLVETQIENLRSKTTGLVSGGCFDSTGRPQDGSGSSCAVLPNGPGTQPVYTMGITPDPSGDGVFIVTGKWDSLTGSGTNNVTMYYRPVAP